MNLRFCSPGRILPYLFYFSLLYLLLWCWKPVRAQSVAGFKPLQIGDKVPDVTINNILHYQTPNAKLSDFKGKLVILDFWATWCAPCIGMIPRMDSLARRFEDDIMFLPVTYQSQKQITDFRDKYARRTGLRIAVPEVVSDTALRSLFAYNAIPHYVWIGADQKVVAITGLEDIDTQKVAAFAAGKPASFSRKSDAVSLGYSAMDKSLFDFFNETEVKQPAYHAFYSPYIKGLRSQAILKTIEGSQNEWRVTFTNVSPLAFYKYAYGEGKRFFSLNTISLETKDSLNFNNNYSGAALREWIPLNTYCYELIVPRSMAEKAFFILQDDLRRFLPQYAARIEKRKKKVLALIRTSQEDKIKSKSNLFSEHYDKFSYQVRRKSMADFMTGLNGIYMHGSEFSIVDHTGYQGFIDLDLDVNFAQVDDVNRGLAPYDLKLVERMEDVDTLVITDRQPSAN